jgi:putative ABC transport system permease protein
VTLWTIAARNTLRKRFRTTMTVLGGAVAVLAFIMLRTVLDAWNVGVAYAAKDRLSTRNKVSFGVGMPKRYVDEIATKVQGVKNVTYCDWFGAKWAKDPNESFSNIACADNAFEVYPELEVDPAALARWKADKTGAIVGDMLAKKLGLHVGDTVTLEGSFYPGDWQFTIQGTYTAPRQAAVDRSTFFLRWDYKNDRVPERQKDNAGWIFARVDDASRSAEVARAIDRIFEDREIQTATMSERAANNLLLGGVSAVLDAVDVVSFIILAIMMLILGNTIAMSVRERIAEFGVLRAIGFPSRQISAFIIGEAMLVALFAGLLGLGLSFPLVQMAMGKWLEENVGHLFPSFRISVPTMIGAILIAPALGAFASLLPAIRAGKIPVTEALRRTA